jgi:Lon protease-like protein
MDLLPLFPLPGVVLFPNVFLPLHVFEPRYREMVADAIAGDRVVGMVLLKEGWKHDYEGRPPVYPIGCSGVITHCEQLENGRYNIILRGVERFRILQEDHTRAYRRAEVEPLIEGSSDEHTRAALRRQRSKLEVLLASSREPSASDPRSWSAMSDADLVHALAQYLDLEPIEKQALLERDSVTYRAESLVELLEMKMLIARMPGVPQVAH